MFKDVKGYEKYYEISSEGIVRSKDRTQTDPRGRTRTWKGKVLKPDIAQNGYYRVTFSIHKKKETILPSQTYRYSFY